MAQPARAQFLKRTAVEIGLNMRANRVQRIAARSVGRQRLQARNPAAVLRRRAEKRTLA